MAVRRTTTPGTAAVRPGTLLPDVLRGRAALEPERTAYVFVNERAEETGRLTYGGLHARALAVAGELSRACEPGDRALLVFPQCLDFVVAYLGCLYARVVAVPVHPPHRDGVQDSTRRIVDDCEPAAVLTLEAMARELRAALTSPRGAMSWIPVDRIPAGPAPTGIHTAGIHTVDVHAAGLDPTAVEPMDLDPADIAFLQYTSGSTSDPKGVMVSHGNLAANQEMIRRAFGHDRDSTVVGWAPFFHDQGLIGNVLQPLYAGATCVLMSPTAFIRWPMLWLSLISRYRAHTSGGPNFAFEACVARAARGGVPDLDLSCWKVAFNGAEPVRHDTLRRFAETFAPHGFDERALYPCYGLAEATLLVTGSEKGRGARVIEAATEDLREGRYTPVPAGRGSTLVGSGVLPRDGALRIVDPRTGRSLPPDRIGEIWVAGDHVARGYWDRPRESTETFHAEHADDPGRGYLRTGDLGLVVDDELFVVGRLKDLVIIRGRNYYPQDLEHTAQSAHPALRPGGCAAFSVPGADRERLVIVQEVRGEFRRRADPGEVAGAIRAAVVREHQVSVGDLVLTLPGRLQKTTSGKIMRAAARRRYLRDAFDRWTPSTSPSTDPATGPSPSTDNPRERT
ncbi:AMP-dependent synthetase and ligase [Frankia sp. Hr75.2]|nr:AMP-dependent synthetase and ligase [Frankia sp. Hr75.2]